MEETQNKPIDYKKISTYYFIGTLFNNGISFLTVPIFTRLLSTQDYGIVTTYNSSVSIISMIICCALYMGVRAAFIDYKYKIDDVLASLTTFVLINGLASTVVVLFIANIFNLRYPNFLILLCMIHSIGAGLIQNYSMYLMMQYRYKFRTALMVLPNAIAVAFSLVAIVFVLKTDLYMGRIVPTAITQSFFGLLTVILVYRKSRDFIDNKYIKYCLTISLPLVLHGIALNILSQSDRVMITSLRSASETGIYSLIYNFGMIATVITTALDGVWVPWFTERLKSGNTEAINKRSKEYIELMTVAMMELILIGPEVVKFMADKKYWDGITIIPPIVLANYAIFAYTLYVNIEHFHKKTVYITINTLIAAGVNIVTNYIFIPMYGYLAAAYTTLFSYGIALILHASYAKKLEKKLYPINYFAFPFFKILVAVIAFYLVLDHEVWRWIIAIALFAIEAVTHKALVQYAFPFLKGKLNRNK